MSSSPAQPIARHLEIDALLQVVRWPDVAPQTVLALAGQLLAAGRDDQGFHYFRERAEVAPDQPLLLALEGLFQARLAGKQPLLRRRGWVLEALGKLDRAVAAAPGLTTYFRGIVLADLPGMFGKADAAAADLEWVLANKERFPVGLLRNVYRGLAKAYANLGRAGDSAEALERSGYRSLDADGPLFTADYWMTRREGFHFVPPRLVEPAPGIYVAQGYDFADFAFVLTDDGLVAIDAGTTVAHARAALRDLRRIADRPIRVLILTHAHWDHVGGLDALRGPGTTVIAQAGIAHELALQQATGVPFIQFFGTDAEERYDVVPDRLVSEPETLTVGGTRIDLYPVRGETDDALLIHLPERGVVFTGDLMMRQLGPPFLPEGSAEGLFEAMRLIRSLEPELLIHGHTPLTTNFTIEALPGLEAALRELHGRVLDVIRDGSALVKILHANHLPGVLRAHPSAVVPFLVMRDNVVKRVYHQRTGYWKPDGEGIERFSRAEWAGALNLLGGRKESAFVRSVETLLAQHDDTLALELAQLGLAAYPASQALAALRLRALHRLRERYQQLNPFKFIVYSGWAEAELPPIDTAAEGLVTA